MAFQLSDDEQLIEKVVAEFANTQVTLEGAADRDRHNTFPTAAWAAAAGLGLTSMSVDDGPGATAYALAILELARVDPAMAAVLCVHNTALRLAPGDGITALALTEEAHGSDKATLGTVERGGKITGMKVWVTAAAAAGRFLVLARGETGPAIYEVAADADGVTLGSDEQLLGLRSAGIRTVYFDEVAASLVSEPGQGLAAYHEVRPWLQVGAAAALTGAVLGGFAAAAEFASTRVQFGQAIGHYGAVSDMITEIDLQAHAARALVLEAAAHLGKEDAATWAARAKAFAAEMAVPMTRKNIRVQGGTGFMREGGTERFARDARTLLFLGEPPALQREILKRQLLDIDFGPAP